MIRYIVYIGLLLFSISSCKSDSKTAQATPPPAEEAIEDDGPVKTALPGGGYKLSPTDLEYDLTVPTNQSVAGKSQIAKFRSQAEAILDKRIADNPNIPAVIDMGTFFYEFIVKGGEVSEVGSLDNKWVDYASDHTYSYGYNREVQGGGRFHYDSDKAVVLMLDNDPSIKPQEFDAKHAGMAMVLVGRPTYKDNNMQMKLSKVLKPEQR